jgi:CDP-diacylglycerol--glycerol-3-phosphate 3-phosphatidyltransferase
MYADGLWSAFFFALASLTDWLDGLAARKFAQGTELGKFLDPLADKFLVLTVLILLAVQLRIEVLPVLILVVREFAVMGLRCAVLEKGGAVVAASRLAKWKTAAQMLALFLLLADWPFGREVFYVSFVLAVISGAEYFWAHRDSLK